MNREQRIIRASWVGISVNAVLALTKIIGGYVFASLAVIGDGIDSANDVAMYVITLITARIISRPPDRKFPYGYNRAEAIATKLLSFFIFFIGAQLIWSSAKDLWYMESSHIPEIGAIVVTLISIFVKLGLSAWQMKEGKTIDSPMIIANAVNMRNDIVLSIGVLLGVFFSVYLSLDWLDHFLGLLVGLWILKVAFDLFKTTSLELMDGGVDPVVYDKIFEATNSVKGVFNPHRLRVRKLSNRLIIDIDIEVEPLLTMEKVHVLGLQVENAIKAKVENVYDIMIHFEPLGNIEDNEPYGVRYKK